MKFSLKFPTPTHFMFGVALLIFGGSFTYSFVGPSLSLRKHMTLQSEADHLYDIAKKRKTEKEDLN